MRMVEFTEECRINGRIYMAGARDAFEPAVAQQYLDLGWAKDPETGEQGERKPGTNGPLLVDNVVTTAG